MLHNKRSQMRTGLPSPIATPLILVTGITQYGVEVSMASSAFMTL